MLNELKADYKRNRKSKKVLVVITIYRLGNKIYYSKIPNLIRKILLVIIRLNQLIFSEMAFGIEIPFEAKIGGGIRLVHLNGIVIGADAVIGDRCTIFHQVTIGANEHKINIKKTATIGDNVYIGCGAKIIGNIKIGNNVKIGANAVVTKDVQDGLTVTEFNRQTYNKSERSA